MNYEDHENLRLTPEQIKVAKGVYRAMRKAEKVGIQFWDNYGTLECYNGKKIERLNMEGDVSGNVSIREFDITYYEGLRNFSPGNSDDEIWAEIR